MVSKLGLTSAFLCLFPVRPSCQQRGAESPNHVNPDFSIMCVEIIQPLDFSLKGLLDCGALQGEMGWGGVEPIIFKDCVWAGERTTPDILLWKD